MESLRQKDAGLVKVMEEALLGTMWGTAEFLCGRSLSRSTKKLENTDIKVWVNILLGL